VVRFVLYFSYLYQDYKISMKVKILEVASGELVGGAILGRKDKLPGLHEGWKFSFDKHIKLPYSTGYVLVAEETPDTIEGCLIFQMKEKVIPYMAFVELAPHNQENPKRYDFVAGCLIAFAWQQSIIRGKEHFKGLLAFDVQEEKEKDKIKLMSLYSKKYGAVRAGDTLMYIVDTAGEALVEEYLKRN
jgi:hypothetical protein